MKFSRQIRVRLVSNYSGPICQTAILLAFFPNLSPIIPFIQMLFRTTFQAPFKQFSIRKFPLRETLFSISPAILYIFLYCVVSLEKDYFTPCGNIMPGKVSRERNLCHRSSRRSTAKTNVACQRARLRTSESPGNYVRCYVCTGCIFRGHSGGREGERERDIREREWGGCCWRPMRRVNDRKPAIWTWRLGTAPRTAVTYRQTAGSHRRSPPSLPRLLSLSPVAAPPPDSVTPPSSLTVARRRALPQDMQDGFRQISARIDAILPFLENRIRVWFTLRWTESGMRSRNKCSTV